LHFLARDEFWFEALIFGSDDLDCEVTRLSITLVTLWAGLGRLPRFLLCASGHILALAAKSCQKSTFFTEPRFVLKSTYTSKGAAKGEEAARPKGPWQSPSTQ